MTPKQELEAELQIKIKQLKELGPVMLGMSEQYIRDRNILRHKIDIIETKLKGKSQTHTPEFNAKITKFRK